MVGLVQVDGERLGGDCRRSQIGDTSLRYMGKGLNSALKGNEK